jgi:DNA-binding FrmR family transcriptional regulator
MFGDPARSNSLPKEALPLFNRWLDARWATPPHQASLCGSGSVQCAERSAIFGSLGSRPPSYKFAFGSNIPYHGMLFIPIMAHVIQNKKKLLARISRIRGQLNGIERVLDEGRDCGEVLLALAACRGALNALMAEILEGHVRQHLLSANSKESQISAGEELIEVIKRYLK